MYSPVILLHADDNVVVLQAFRGRRRAYIGGWLRGLDCSEQCGNRPQLARFALPALGKGDQVRSADRFNDNGRASRRMGASAQHEKRLPSTFTLAR